MYILYIYILYIYVYIVYIYIYTHTQMNTKVCSVTSKPSQSSNRRVAHFKDSSVLLNSTKVKSQK